MTGRLWLRGEAYVHGALPVGVGLLARDERATGAASPLASPAHEHSRAAQVEHGFETLGSVVASARERQLGPALLAALKDGQDAATAAADIVEAAWRESGRDQAPGRKDCCALVHVFCALVNADSRLANRPVAAHARTATQVVAEFAIFLTVQIWREVKQRFPAKESMDVWVTDAPGFDEAKDEIAESPRIRSPRAIALDSLANENEQRLDFVRDHLRDICWLLSLAATTESRMAFLERWDAKELSPEQSRALNMLVDGDDWRDLVLPAGSVRCSHVAQAIRERLALNPAVNPVLLRGVHPICSVSNTRGDMPNDSPVTSESFASDASASSTSSPNPAGSDSLPAAIVVGNMRRKTHVLGDVDIVARSKAEDGYAPQHRPEQDLALASFVVGKSVIFNCTNATIYLLRPSKHIRIVGCHKCVIVLGPCAGLVTVEHCSEIQLHAIATGLSIANSYDSKIFVHTSDFAPILSGDCRNIKFGPFNTFYPRLYLHLQATCHACEQPPGICNYRWTQPTDVTVRTNATTVWSTLPPEEFSVFVTPFIDPFMHMPCVESPFRLPHNYTQAIQAKIKKVEDLLHMVGCATAPAESPKSSFSHESKDERTDQPSVTADALGKAKPELERAIQNAFREWLVTTGNVRQVLDLVKL